MIKKERLQKSVEQLISSQKSLTPLLNRHVTASLQMSGLKEADLRAIVEFLQRHAVVQAGHLEALQQMQATLKNGTRDVF